MRRRFVIVTLSVVLAALAIVAIARYAPLTALNLIARIGGGYERREGIAYGALPRQRLDAYTPRGRAPQGGWPMVVFFYGGSWNHGERDDYAFVGAALAAQGVLTLVADYRLYPEVRYPDFLADSAQALAYGLHAAATLGADPRRVFVMGHSAGAYNAAMLALDPRWLAPTGHAPQELAGWIGLAGPYDFLPSSNTDVQPVFFHPDYPRGAQPIEQAAASTRLRAFIAAPQHDDLVDPVRSSVQLAQRLRSHAVPVELRRYERADHATLIGAFSGVLTWIAPVRADVLAFLRRGPGDTAQP